MRLFTRLSPIALALVLGLSAAPASAQSDADKATARQMGIEGQEALDKKDFKTAEDRFRRADSLFKAPTLALGLARAYAGNGKFVAAQETYNRIIREVQPGAPAAFIKAAEDAKAEVGAVSAKIGTVIVNVTGAENPKVTLDEQPFPNAALGIRRAVDPGTHVVRATAEGYKPAEARVTITEAGSGTATLNLEKDPNAAVAPVPPPPPAGGMPPPPGDTTGGGPPPDVGTSGGSMNKTLGFVALGVGGVGLAVGAITGVIAMGKHSDLEKVCTDGKCTSDRQSDVDSYQSMGTISTIGFIVGGVGIAGGLVLILTAPKDSRVGSSARPLVALPERPAPARGFISPVIGPASVGAVGRF